GNLAQTLPIDGEGGGRERNGGSPPLRVLDRQVQGARTAHRVSHHVCPVVVDLEFLANQIDDFERFPLAQLAQVRRIVRVIQQPRRKRAASSLRRRRSSTRSGTIARSAASGVGGRRRWCAAASPPLRRRRAVPAARVV